MRLFASALLGIGIVTVVGCAAPEGVTEARGDSESHIEEGSTAGDGCDVAAGQERAKAVLERTTSCALDAATAGLGSKFELAAKAFGDTKDLVQKVRAFKKLVKVTDLSSARAAMCLAAVGEYAADAAVEDILTSLAVGLSAAEISDLADSVKGQFSLGLTDTFTSFNEMTASPSAETITSFLTQLASNGTEIADFVNVCGSALAPFGTVAIPNIARYSKIFETAGTITSIIDCGATVIFNARDVYKEWTCYAADLKRLEQQSKQLQSANDDRCAAFASYVQDPIMSAVIGANGDRSDARVDACYAVVHHWGSCVYDAKRSGILGQTKLSCDECAKVCEGYVNDAGDNAYLRPVIDGGFSRAGATRQQMQKLVMDANSCAREILADGNQACINFCRGQVADCP
ncbi:MAG: hypothetical protein U0270_38750 [Labilithrix sp.]